MEDNIIKINSFRKSILEKAFKGKLVPQDPKDESADKLLERIKKDKSAQANDKKKNMRGQGRLF